MNHFLCKQNKNPIRSQTNKQKNSYKSNVKKKKKTTDARLMVNNIEIFSL